MSGEPEGWQRGGPALMRAHTPQHASPTHPSPSRCVVDAAAVLFLFDLTSLPSLYSIKEWFRQVRGLNKAALPFLVGTKFDVFMALTPEEQVRVCRNSRTGQSAGGPTLTGAPPWLATTHASPHLCRPRRWTRRGSTPRR